ncbi:Transposase IS4 [Popillia japonica]|uniref:Transposase IS4 n=1 Tax=Popillia japonica TaxID=7064 RepID=A0AAW1KJM7_POPJA
MEGQKRCFDVNYETYPDMDMIEVPARNEAKMKPKPVAEYNCAKSFIDLSDQMSSYSTSLRRSLKWDKKVTVEMLLGASIVNAHYLYNKNEDKQNRRLLAVEMLLGASIVNAHYLYNKNEDKQNRRLLLRSKTTSGCNLYQIKWSRSFNQNLN